MLINKCHITALKELAELVIKKVTALLALIKVKFFCNYKYVGCLTNFLDNLTTSDFSNIVTVIIASVIIAVLLGSTKNAKVITHSFSNINFFPTLNNRQDKCQWRLYVLGY